MTPLVRVTDLKRAYGDVFAIDGISLTLEAGAPIGVVGPNGAGKTTFFSVLCGFLRPTRGTVEVMGRPPLHPELYGRVAILPQDAAFVRGVPVWVQLAFLAELQGFDRAAAKAEAARVLKSVLLEDAAGKPPEAMSHGMLKRVAIAQTFIGSPELVFLDEPTAGLDPASAEHVRSLVRSLAGERTFIVSSHNLDDIEQLCGSIVILKQGKVTEHRKVSELVSRTSCLTLRLEADPPENAGELFGVLPGVTRVERGRPGEHRLTVHYRESDADAAQVAVLQALSKAGIAFLEMSRGQSLQDRVVEMTRRD